MDDLREEFTIKFVNDFCNVERSVGDIAAKGSRLYWSRSAGGKPAFLLYNSRKCVIPALRAVCYACCLSRRFLCVIRSI